MMVVKSDDGDNNGGDNDGGGNDDCHDVTMSFTLCTYRGCDLS